MNYFPIYARLSQKNAPLPPKWHLMVEQFVKFSLLSDELKLFILGQLKISLVVFKMGTFFWTPLD